MYQLYSVFCVRLPKADIINHTLGQSMTSDFVEYETHMGTGSVQKTKLATKLYSNETFISRTLMY